MCVAEWLVSAASGPGQPNLIKVVSVSSGIMSGCLGWQRARMPKSTFWSGQVWTGLLSPGQKRWSGLRELPPEHKAGLISSYRKSWFQRRSNWFFNLKFTDLSKCSLKAQAPCVSLRVSSPWSHGGQEKVDPAWTSLVVWKPWPVPAHVSLPVWSL